MTRGLANMNIVLSRTNSGETWLVEIETWLSQPRSPADDEVKRELGRRVPGYQSAAAEGGVREIQEKG